MGHPLRAFAALLGGAALVALALSWNPSSPEPPAVAPAPDQTLDYLPGLAADVYLPAAATHRPPVVVLVPGGGWQSADRTGLGALARTLAEHGMVAVTITYSVGQGRTFPEPVHDLVCALGFARARTTAAGFAAGPVVLLGHSAGAQLAALAALAPQVGGGASCPYAATRADGLVGLSGPYDVSRLPELAIGLFGVPPAADPARWRDGNPLTWTTPAPGDHAVPVLLAHGTADTVVPLSFSTAFATALRTGGHPVQLVELPGVGHGDIYSPAVIASTVVGWVAGLAR